LSLLGFWSCFTGSLTTSADSFTGTSGNDTFNAANAAGTAAGQTFNSDDVLVGGAGTDTLSATIGAANTYALSSVSGIETVKANFTALGTVSLLGSSGVTSVTSNNSTATAIFTNIDSTSVGLGVTNSDQSATFTFTTAAVEGTTDSATLTLSSQTGGTDVIAGVETLNIVSSGSANALTTMNYLAAELRGLNPKVQGERLLSCGQQSCGELNPQRLTAANATTINISGAQTLNLGTAIHSVISNGVQLQRKALCYAGYKAVIASTYMTPCIIRLRPLSHLPIPPALR